VLRKLSELSRLYSRLSLLLNLLIARFAKTFDLIYENVDSNFKVQFARVVLKGAGE
jgi:hypothetical protein